MKKLKIQIQLLQKRNRQISVKKMNISYLVIK